MVGLLAAHPWFEPKVLTASERSAGLSYAEATTWIQTEPLPPAAASLQVQPTTVEAVRECPLVLSALDASVADEVEEPIARAGHLLVSNTKSHRMDPQVPLVVPEVNPDHLELARHQELGGGNIVTNPNCSTIGLVLALKPLADAFGVKRALVVTMQAVSGAGLPGVSSLQMVDNLIPYIGGEEEKLEQETRKIFGRLAGDHVDPDEIEVSAQCNRVPVMDGHTLCVSVELAQPAPLALLREAWAGFVAEPQERKLPSAPERPVELLEEPDAPQPRRHRDRGLGMTATVGRLRECPVLDYKFVTLSHNTLRGAAGGSLLLAELAIARGLLGGVSGSGITRR
jgi:aspartate-semialdehyde dehydrogenase